MFARCLIPFVLVVVAVSFGTVSAYAADATHEGVVVKVEAHILTMSSKAGEQHIHHVASETAITVDGKPAKLEDIKPGFHLIVAMAGDKVTKIDAHSKTGKP